MLRQLILGSLSLLSGAALAIAAPKDDVQAAVQKLADSPNYSWTTTVEGGFGGSTDGKIQKDGYTTYSVATQDNTYVIFIKADKAAIQTPDGWKTAEEMLKADDDNGGGGGGFNPERFIAMRAQNFKAPAAQTADLLTKVPALQSTDDGFTADLTTDAATQLLRFRRPPAGAAAAGGGDNNGPQFSDVKGSVKFWIKDGVLSKVQTHLTGTRSFNGDDQPIDRTTTTEIKDLGTTTIDVPADAKAKLGS